MPPKIRIIIGSKSDLDKIAPAREILDRFDVSYDLHISSAHRNPENTIALAQNAKAEGIEIIIAGAGMAAHLPGIIAAHTTLPVIGIPFISGALNGLDSLFSIVQMPSGVPVACMAINGAKNAALFAIQILALKDKELEKKFSDYKAGLKA
ncbi:MAG TPA: 5-(carboxyamino)imidazole ribonucleotide mutase [Candidatus Cloacimonas sp.]|jgi:5-(carboxyamino)imidazole ribonucleotide mutase|nr:5-(carboxyamino)imidazole ribonucleotide mutase [Candidatus Cloacimonas sp.]HPS59793.1 5-(carboxyamino)imidazole ribonucleotide mutase [Candidatus Cloacimonas sp.]